MRLVVFTTETLHHAYYVREIARQYRIDLVLSEQSSVMPPFEVKHAFEDQRDEHERARFFGGAHASIKDFGEVLDVDGINSQTAAKAIEQARPDVILVFGTGVIRPEVIGLCPEGMINLHGGDPERYRGLDSQLWAIYHNDFSALVTTLHRVNPTLDDGDIILQERLRFDHGAGLEQLRAVNTDACVRISLAALDMFSRFGQFVSRPQIERGRYYSFMPGCLKESCIARFAKFTGKAS
jgi:methionyl-tRNA formyltransferase